MPDPHTRVLLRKAAAGDEAFLWEMLAAAVFVNPPWTVEQARSDPSIAHYLVGWHRPGDRVLVAWTGEGDRNGDQEGDVGGQGEGVKSRKGGIGSDGDEVERIGAAWYRYLPAEDPGFGFVDPAIPEVTMALLPGWRGRGIGQILLQALMREAGAAGANALSLSVDPSNGAALQLYQRLGFVAVATDPGGSITMLGRTNRP